MHDATPAPASDHPTTTGDVVVGRFAANLSTGRWWWSDQAYRIHGLEPAEVDPSTDLVLARTHPDDRAHVRGVLRQTEDSREPFASVHRIVGADGQDRVVSVVGEARQDHESSRKVIGYVQDLTTTVEDLGAERAREAARAAAKARRDVEQATAIVGMLLDVDDDVALGVLRQESEVTGATIGEVSLDVVTRARETAREYCLSPDVLPRLLRS